MTNPREQYPGLSPVAVLGETIASRQEDFAYLYGAFEIGMELVSNMDRVNEIISASSRPDLVMTERVDVMPVESPWNLGRINNFVPSMMSFGMRVYGEGKNWKFEPDIVVVGRRPYTDEERALVFYMGARGGYVNHLAFAAANEIDEDFAKDVVMVTAVDEEAFMRMWIVLPELTEWLMDHCLDTGKFRNKHINEELFVAYTLMARLADRNDRDMIKEDGSVDTWKFCH